MVLIHGFGGGTFSWRLVMAPLAARAGCRVLALDRPGFGCGARQGTEHMLRPMCMLCP